MEVIEVVFAVIVAIVAVGVAAVLLIKVVKVPPPRNMWKAAVSTSGVPLIVLGVAATFIYSLLNLSLFVPVLVTVGGIVALAVGLWKRDDR